MGRISASGAQDLYNAYASVYKTTEEDFSEIESLCEEWLQERIEEEFDFSQYTIEELAEAIQGGLMDRAKQDGAARRAAQGAAFKSFADRGGVLGFLQRRLQGTRDRVQQSGGPRGQGNRPIAGNPNRQGGSPLAADIAASRRQAARLGDAPARETGVPRGQVPPGATVTAKPVAPKPAAAAPAKPASAATPPAKPASAVTPAAEPAPAKRPSILSGLDDLKKMRMASQIRQKTGAPNITSDMIGDKSVKAPTTPRPQLSARAQALKAGGPKLGPRERMLNQDLDLFDIVKGHLLDEGYAETEEAALAIMSNMSEDWRNEIIESSCGGGHSKKKKKKSGY